MGISGCSPRRATPDSRYSSRSRTSGCSGQGEAKAVSLT
jgi:hypothetical protein